MATRRFARIGVLVVLSLTLLCGDARATVVYAPPDDSPDAANELRAIEREIADRNVGAAAKRLDALLAARGDLLASVGEGTLASAAAWLDHLPPESRAGLTAQYASAFGKPAAQMLESLRKSPSARPEELYAIARRYPLTPAAAQALADAGDRAAMLGDLPAAQALYELAGRADPQLLNARVPRLEMLKSLNAAAFAPLLPDLPQRAAAGRPPFAGPLPFDARWYGNPSLAGIAKYFPLACGDGGVLLATARGVTLFDAESGRARWDSPHPRAAPVRGGERGVPGTRGPLFAPAILSDVHARPVIAVARYPAGAGEESTFVLRGLSAADGKTLWTTDSPEQRKDLTYAGLPTIAGRYVYSVAVARTGVSTGNLVLSALDVTSGSPFWQTTIGSVAEQGEQRQGGRKNIRNDPLSLDAFADLSEPAVAGDCVYVAPNCGSIIAVGRFDGRIRWVHVYREPEAPVAGAAGNPRDLRVKPGHWMDARDAQRAPLLRYRSTPVVCGDVVVAMPQDVPAVFAVNQLDGRRLWDTDIIDGFGLAGGSGRIVIACAADTVCGIDAITAKLKWKHRVAGAGVTGPPVVLGRTLVIPTSAGPVQLDAEDGAEHAVYALPSFHRVLAGEGGGRSTAVDPFAARSFGMPSSAR
jgi:outer membrane protein assembly factor BamB